MPTGQRKRNLDGGHLGRLGQQKAVLVNSRSQGSLLGRLGQQKAAPIQPRSQGSLLGSQEAQGHWHHLLTSPKAMPVQPRSRETAS